MTQILQRVFVIVPAAGQGSRMKMPHSKLQAVLSNQPVLFHTLQRFIAFHTDLKSLNTPKIQTIVVALPKEDLALKAVVNELSVTSPFSLITCEGGSSRHLSVQKAYSVLRDMLKASGNPLTKTDWILIHDGARPCLSLKDLDNLLRVFVPKKSPVSYLATPVTSTLRTKASHNNSYKTVDRDQFIEALTPQLFTAEALEKVLEQKADMVTDEVAAAENMGIHSEPVMGRRDNIKVTYPEDLVMAEAILNTVSKKEDLL